MKKRIKPVLFILCAIISVAMAYTVFTNAGNNKTAYVALGDSIAAGYGLDGYSPGQETPPYDSYQSVVASFLKTVPYNYAVSGDDSNSCINILNSGKADDALATADIVTVSIGSNDLLKPFTEIVKETLQITGGNSPSIADILAAASDLYVQLKDNKILYEKAQAFSANFAVIINLLKQKAPKAEIYVTNIYNPYKYVMLLDESADSYIKEINKAFDTDSDDYTVIDLYTMFNNKELTNVRFDISDLPGINLDPHPSKEGHKEIASAILNALDKKHAPGTPDISSIKSTAKNQISVKLLCPTAKSGYEIKFSLSKNKKFKLLAATTKNKTVIKSSKLKPGKTYYIKARSYNNVNGIKYYSAYSQLKKVHIKSNLKNHGLPVN